jgi:hypothetical protein
MSSCGYTHRFVQEGGGENATSRRKKLLAKCVTKPKAM